MQGIIKNFRRSIKSQHYAQAIIELDGVDSKKKAAAFLGSRVQWKQKKGKSLRGKIIAVHGNNGAVRARFTPALPGQAIGDRVEITEKGKQAQPTKPAKAKAKKPAKAAKKKAKPAKEAKKPSKPAKPAKKSGKK